jgi:hypothetical protein
MRKEPERDADAYAQAIAERDEAIAERDFILKFLQEIGAALNTADADAVKSQLRTVRAMVRLAGDG